MKIYRLINAWAFVLFAIPAIAQENHSSGWFMSVNTIKLSPASKWSLHAELQVRSTNKWEHVNNILLRGGINYNVKKNQIATVGVAYVPSRNVIADDASLLAEHRFWQQYIINQPVKKTVIQHRFRLEERFVAKGKLENGDVKTDERRYSTRLRYFIRAVIPFSKQQPFTKGMFLGLQEEVFANITDKQNVNGRFFDQNRGYLALGYRVSKKLDVEVGYMNQYVQRAKGQTNIMNHIAQLAVYTRL